MDTRVPVHVKLPPDLVETMRDEARLRRSTLTAVIEERCRAVSPLHEKLERIVATIKDEIYWSKK